MDCYSTTKPNQTQTMPNTLASAPSSKPDLQPAAQELAISAMWQFHSLHPCCSKFSMYPCVSKSFAFSFSHICMLWHRKVFSTWVLCSRQVPRDSQFVLCGGVDQLPNQASKMPISQVRSRNYYQINWYDFFLRWVGGLFSSHRSKKANAPLGHPLREDRETK